MADPDKFESLFLNHLSWVKRCATWLCRHYGLDADETDDFISHVVMQLISNDYEILQRFSGQGSFNTYLTAVISQLFLHYRAELWGNWRSSAAAKRLGTVAVQLERLVYGDGHTVHSAGELLRERGITDLPDMKLQAILAELPTRTPLEDGDPLASTSLQRAIDELPPEDRLLVRLHWREGFTIAQIAHALDLEQKPLYRRTHRILENLRRNLEVSAENLEAAVEHPTDLGDGDEVEALPPEVIERLVRGGDEEPHGAVVPTPASIERRWRAPRWSGRLVAGWRAAEGTYAQRQIAKFAGGLLSSSDLAKRLHTDVDDIKQRVENREVLAVRLADGQLRFPALQLRDGNHVRPGTGEVVKAGAHVDAWVLLSILIDDVASPAEGTILEHLDNATVLADVLNRLATYGEHVAG